MVAICPVEDLLLSRNQCKVIFLERDFDVQLCRVEHCEIVNTMEFDK